MACRYRGGSVACSQDLVRPLEPGTPTYLGGATAGGNAHSLSCLPGLEMPRRPRYPPCDRCQSTAHVGVVDPSDGRSHRDPLPCLWFAGISGLLSRLARPADGDAGNRNRSSATWHAMASIGV